jgi:outer membrane protein assembly factor BamB
MCFRILYTAAVVLLTVTNSAVAQVAWPDFRGPGTQGVIDSTSAPLTWSENEHVAWKAEVPGRGWSSPVVIGNQVWLTTAIETKADDSERKRRAEGSATPDQMALAKHVSLRAVCFDRATGEQLSEVKLFEVDQPEPIHSLNSYASPSPVAEDHFVYAHFGRYGTACIDITTKEVVWRNAFPINHYVGPGSSPALAGDLLVLTCDGGDKQFIVAVNKSDGEVAWREDRPPIRATNPDLRKAYCTPLVAEIGGRLQVVIPGAQWVISYDPKTGDEIWRVDHGPGFSLVARPVTDGQYVYTCTGFMESKVMKIDATGEGDVTDSHVKWSVTNSVPVQPSLVLVDGRLFMVNDSGIAQCVDAGSGSTLWKKRLSGNFSASPFAVGDEVLFVSREGVTTVMPTDGSDEVIRRNELDARLMATPVVLPEQVLVRSETHLYCIE